MPKFTRELWPIEACSGADHASTHQFWGPQDTVYPRQVVGEPNAAVAPGMVATTGSYATYYIGSIHEFDLSHDINVAVDFRSSYNGASESGKTYDVAVVIRVREIAKKMPSLGTPLTRFTQQMPQDAAAYWIHYPNSSAYRVFRSNVTIPAGALKSNASALELLVGMTYQSSATFSGFQIAPVVVLTGEERTVPVR